LRRNLENPVNLGRLRPAGDVSAWLLEPLVFMCFAAHSGMQAEAVDYDTHGLSRRILPRRGSPEGQHLVASACRRLLLFLGLLGIWTGA
jgi:hypothetical protein